MKKLLFLFLLITISTVAFSQKKEDNHSINIQNFKYDPSTKLFTWQKIYDCEDITQVLKHIKLMRFIVTYSDSTSIIGNTIYGVLPVDKYELFNLKNFITINCPTVIYFNIDIKDKKYRVTVTRIECHTKLGKLDLSSFYVVNDKKLRKIAFNDMPIYNNYLTSIFDINETISKDVNW